MNFLIVTMLLSLRKTLRNVMNCIISKLSRRRNRRNNDVKRMEEILENLALDDLVTVKTFASGTWGAIDLVHIKNEPENCFALKKIKKSKLKTPTDRANMLNEKQVLSSIKCDFILKFYKTFVDPKHLYIMTEYCSGGDLFNRQSFSEAGSIFYVGCIVEALEYLHTRNIVHRDLKLENLVLDGHGYLKLIDFGMAKKLEQGEKLYSFCGTLVYMAPEMITVSKPGYDVGVDLWALGTLICEFMFGEHPMESPRRQEIKRRILIGFDDILFPDDAPNEGTDFIRKLCRDRPEERLGYGPGGFDNLRKHCWFKKFNWRALRKRKLTPPIVPKLRDAMDTSCFTQKVKEEQEEDLPDADLDQFWSDF